MQNLIHFSIISKSYPSRQHYVVTRAHNISIPQIFNCLPEIVLDINYSTTRKCASVQRDQKLSGIFNMYKLVGIFTALALWLLLMNCSNPADPEVDPIGLYEVFFKYADWGLGITRDDADESKGSRNSGGKTSMQLENTRSGKRLLLFIVLSTISEQSPVHSWFASLFQATCHPPACHGRGVQLVGKWQGSK